MKINGDMQSKEYYKKLFPLLNDYELINNSESDNYNCISHTLGIKDKWSWSYDKNEIYEYDYDHYWPVRCELTKESFDDFYEYHGFEKIKLLDFSYNPKYTKVVLYTNNGVPTHAAIQINEFFWESKIGMFGILRHDLFEIENDVYGEVTQIYRKLKNINESKILKYYQFIRNLDRIYNITYK